MGELIEKLGIDWRLLIFNTITLLIVMGVLQRFAFKPLMAMIERRQKDMSDAVDHAQRVKAEAEAAAAQKAVVIQQAKAEAANIVQTAKHDGDRLRQQLVEQAKADVAAVNAKGQQQLAQDKQRMLSEAQGELAGLVVSATEKVIGDVLTDAAHEKLAAAATKALKV